MNRWQKVALAAVFAAVVGSAGGGTATADAPTFQGGRILWSAPAADDDGSSYAVKGGIGNQYRALGGS